ncbi:MAG: XdhC family protein, partial [Candidatus Adiutrix sp.]
MNNDILQRLNKKLNEGRPVVLATVVKTNGSTPRKPGSQMLVFEEGQIFATIGGGSAEAMVCEKATLALAEKKSFLVNFIMNASVAAAEGMACG